MEAAILAKQHEELEAHGFKRRLSLLVPFNALVFAGTLKYCRNVHRISNYFIPPHMRKVSVRNLFVVATVQASFFTTFYLGSVLLILGINPAEQWRQHEREKEEEFQMIARYRVNVDGDISQMGLVGKENELQIMESSNAGVPIRDTFIVSLFKSLGLSDRTILEIENDLRDQTKVELERRPAPPV